jgi:hypothetical protein
VLDLEIGTNQDRMMAQPFFKPSCCFDDVQCGLARNDRARP